jgi:hypothetical protein
MHFCHFLYRLLDDKIQIACFLYCFKKPKNFQPFQRFDASCGQVACSGASPAAVHREMGQW